MGKTDLCATNIAPAKDGEESTGADGHKALEAKVFARVGESPPLRTTSWTGERRDTGAMTKEHLFIAEGCGDADGAEAVLLRLLSSSAVHE